MYFFQAGALFCTENAKFGPILANLAILLQIYTLFGVLLQGGGVPKLTNIRNECGLRLCKSSRHFFHYGTFWLTLALQNTQK
jgi:hypothetical protein